MAAGSGVLAIVGASAVTGLGAHRHTAVSAADQAFEQILFLRPGGGCRVSDRPLFFFITQSAPGQRHPGLLAPHSDRSVS